MVDGDPDRGLVGRQTEQRLLRHLLDDARAGRPAVAVLWGVPGVGKTALLRWLGLAAAAKGALVLRTAGDDWAAPFGAVRRLVAPLPELEGPLGSWSTGAGPGADADVAGGAGADLSTSPDDGVQRFVDAVVDALRSRAMRRPLVVLMDDAHLLGATSAVVLGEVLVALDTLTARPGAQLLVAVTADPDQADGLSHRIARLGAARSLTLSGLDEHAVADMLARAPQRSGGTGPSPGVPVSPALVAAVLRATGGLPLLVEAERDVRSVTAADHDVVAGVDPRIRSIGDVLRLRLDKLSLPARELLDEAALLSPPLATSTLAELTGRPRSEVVGLVDEAMEVGVLEMGTDGVRFTHPLLRAEVAAGAGPEDRARRHLAVAERLEPEGGAAVARMLEQAGHLVQAEAALAGDRRGWAAARLTHAGGMALGAGAWHEASRFLTTALRLGGDDLTTSEWVRRRVTAGTAAWFDHDVEEAERQLVDAVASARRAGDTAGELDAAIRLALCRLSERPLRLGREPPVAELDDALARSARVDDLDDAGVRALWIEGAAVLVEALFASGGTAQAFRLVDMARRRLPATTDQGDDAVRLPRARARLAFAEGLHYLGTLDLDAAEACFHEGVDAAEAAGDALMAVTLRSRVALVELVRGRVDEAAKLVGGVEHEALARRFWGEAAFAAAQRAVVAVLAGSTDAGEVVAAARRLQVRSGHTYSATVLAPVSSALAARRAGLDGEGDDGASSTAGGPGLAERDPDGSTWRLSSAAQVLAGVEADDVPRVRRLVATARWRGGLAGPPTLATLPVLAALVEAGDLLADATLVDAARPGLDAAERAGVGVLLLWPATLPRLQAIAARHAGQLDAAWRHATRALHLAEDAGLRAERAKALVELARLAAPAEGGAGAPDGRTAGDLLDAALRAFDACSMLGWVRRCEALAVELGLADVRRPGGPLVDRTILTTDIVGSTAHNARLGDALYVEVLRVHDRLVRARLGEHGGEEVKHTGDGVNALFHEPAAAVRCALALQRDMADWRRAEPDLAVEVRCGLARGSLIPAGGDYHGIVQSQAARLCALAPAGGVLATQAVVEAGEALPEVAVHPAGRHELRGVPEPVEVLQVLPAAPSAPTAQPHDSQ